jgi:general L-amino acid transport system permease protein
MDRARVRSFLYQLILILTLAWLGYQFALNAEANLSARHIASGFSFLNNTAGFDVNFTLIPYTQTDSYARVFLVSLLNTLLIAGLGVVFATIIGFAVGIARLSSNWLVARIAGAYVEVLRNLPLLFQILFWYLAVLGALPGVRQSISLFGVVFLNTRGIVVPAPLPGGGAPAVGIALAVAVAATVLTAVLARRHRDRTGRRIPVVWIGLVLIVGLPTVAGLVAGTPVEWEVPRLAGFNFTGGLRLIPEFVALLIALSTYTGAFIAEVVRAGILAVPRGQAEAAAALGLRGGLTLRLVVIPQALRVIVPPLTNQYLNLTKNSSLATAIGYPDLVAVFAGTALSQTGQAIEIIAITMAVYLSISLATSALMSWYGARLRLVER